MAQPNNQWQYCEQTTKNHQINKKVGVALKSIDFVCKRDGAKKTPFSEQECIDLDEVETFLASNEKRQKIKTMDVSFGISKGKRGQMVLCELRLNFKNVNNIGRKDLDEKMNNSKRILGHDPSIFSKSFFVFSSKLKQQATNRLRRLYANKSIIEVTDLEGLKAQFFQ